MKQSTGGMILYGFSARENKEQLKGFFFLLHRVRDLNYLVFLFRKLMMIYYVNVFVITDSV